MPLPAIFDPIVNAPKPQKIVLGVVGLGIIIGAAYFLMLSPLQIQDDQLRAQNESLQRVASLRDMKLGGQKTPGSPVRAELTLVTYTYRPVGSPPAPKSTK